MSNNEYIKKMQLKFKEEYEKKIEQEKKKILDRTKSLLEKLVEQYPALKNSEIIEELIENKDVPKEEIVLVQFTHNNQNYYYDKNNLIRDLNGKVVGNIINNKVFLYHDDEFEKEIMSFPKFELKK